MKFFESLNIILGIIEGAESHYEIKYDIFILNLLI